jgi:hypothetical protein
VLQAMMEAGFGSSLRRTCCEAMICTKIHHIALVTD